MNKPSPSVAILGGLALIAAILFLAGQYNQSAAERELAEGRARAMVIEAQGQARLDTATAAAVTSVAMLPWGVLAVLGLLGLATIALVALLVIHRPAPHLIERQIIYLPSPGTPRRIAWQSVAALVGEGETLPTQFLSKDVEIIKV